jgi:hypothetical protein
LKNAFDPFFEANRFLQKIFPEPRFDCWQYTAYQMYLSRKKLHQMQAQGKVTRKPVKSYSTLLNDHTGMAILQKSSRYSTDIPRNCHVDTLIQIGTLIWKCRVV